MAVPKAEQEQPFDFTKTVNYQQLKDMGIKLCHKCGSKQRTDMDGNLMCPINAPECPHLG